MGCLVERRSCRRAPINLKHTVIVIEESDASNPDCVWEVVGPCPSSHPVEATEREPILDQVELLDPLGIVICRCIALTASLMSATLLTAGGIGKALCRERPHCIEATVRVRHMRLCDGGIGGSCGGVCHGGRSLSHFSWR